MQISTIAKGSHLFAAVGLLAILGASIGCPSADKQPVAEPPAPPDACCAAKLADELQPSAKTEEQPADAVEPAAKADSPENSAPDELEQMGEKSRDLGPPLVDNPNALKRLDPKQPVWLDPKNKQVILLGEVCKAGYPLEFFATYSNRSYEAAVSVNVTPSIVHAGLLAAGAEPGHPARFQPEFVAPTGTEVAVECRWKDPSGKLQSAPAQHWIRNIKTGKQLEENWVFAGSSFVTDETTGKQYYQADSGELICVLSLPNAMLDLPIRSYGAIESRLFEAFEEHLPPPGTPTTILLKPILAKKPAAKPPAIDDAKRAEAEQKAVDSAQPWLALADRGQYAKCWETAAELLKNAVERKDFVRSLGGARKPLGELKDRQLLSKYYTTTLPGAPDGQYVVVQYKSSFANRQSATETITPMLGKDKKWRVSGYYIK